ncbi:probable imidazolonepropionase isoform X2 [Zootermopsis nevadensis]|uniref:Probable imidazolonepropionase n=1 Tax=Zootermopsis nevadensis TaxID=136037 RepID=A0A067REA0_ZOONE|nr:probable imidazolonepropionase isoform X2 [Zootermopsis nevadensis]KDR17207.1 putative imidazolonepropionase [Zootermopsis nevadensis]
MRLLIHSAKQVVAITDQDVTCLPGRSMNSVVVLENTNGGVAVAVDDEGKIAAVGSTQYVRELWKYDDFDEVIDATGKCVLPGFVDAHTHPVWAGDRLDEFAMKLAGASYLEIHNAGGGIFHTVDKTVRCSSEELYQSLKDRLLKMLQAGTTTAECKTGYGLETDAELRLLQVLQRAKQQLPIEISITYCGAHAIPKGKTPEEATEIIVRDQIPQIQILMNEKLLPVENIDVFCEKGAFDTEQSRRILQAGKEIGLRINLHGDELNPMQSAEMAAELNATAVSHLEKVSTKGIEVMAMSGTVAILLPTTAYIMRLKPPPVRQLIEAGVSVALGSDFNPNAHCLAMPTVMNLACVTYGMNMPEALVAATLNAAASLGRGRTHGAIQKGRVGDLVVIKAEKWEHIIYQLGCHHHLIEFVVKYGKIVYSSTN